ncbi:MAG: enoyl-CoA hydratase/isomerase family protein [Halanaeroarchaeum sp.]
MSESLAEADYDDLTVTVGEDAEYVATIAVDRPDARNALNQPVRTEFKDAVRRAEADDDARVLVVTGGDASGTFVAGADITEFPERSPIEQREASDRPRVYEVVDGVDLPVIARINGHAFGGGLELAQACDIRIAQSGIKLGQPEINLGIIPGGGGTQRLPRLVGEGTAMRMILSGEPIDAEEAAAIGLVQEIVDEDDLDEAVYSLAATIAEKSPIALEFAKKAVKASSRMSLDQGIEYEAELFAQTFSTADMQEGVTAFLESRDPTFTGE